MRIKFNSCVNVRDHMHRKLFLFLSILLTACAACKNDGTSFEVVHTESSSRGMTYMMGVSS